MKPSKNLSIVVSILLALLITGSCTEFDDDINCPLPSEIDGEYAFCLVEEEPILPDKYDEDKIDRTKSTPQGYYEAGTEVVAVAKPCPGDCGFRGWYDGPPNDGGTLISYDNPFAFLLYEDTYLWAEYHGGY
jgi:hypothetical protein